MPLLEFTKELSSAQRTTLRHLSREDQECKATTGLVNLASGDQGTRYDSLGHWPEYRPLKNKCRFCPKCNVALCLTQQRNCFQDFHT